MKKLNFFKIVPEHSRVVSKHLRMFFKLPRHVFDDLGPIEKISSKNFFHSKSRQNPLFAPIYGENPRKSVIWANFLNFFQNIGSYYDLALSENQYSHVFATFYRRVCRDKFSLAFSTRKSQREFISANASVKSCEYMWILIFWKG